MASARTRIGERWRLLRLRRGEGAVPRSSSEDSTGKARRRAWVEAILPAAALGTLLLLGGGVILSGGARGGVGDDGGGSRYLPASPVSLGIGALVGEADAVEGWTLPWEATPTVCRLHGACVTREGGLVLPAWVGRERKGGPARRLLRACGLTGGRAPAFADSLPLPPPPPATVAPAAAAADAAGPVADTGAATQGGTGGAAAAKATAAAGTATAAAATTGLYRPVDLVLLDAHGAAGTAGTASRLYRLLRGQAYVRAVAGGDGLGDATAGGGRVGSGWWWGWWAALRRHHRYACVGVARTTCALLPSLPLRPVLGSNALAAAGGGGVGALAAAVGEPRAVPAPADGPGAPAVLAAAAASPSADGLVCYRSVVAGTTNLARVPMGGLAWRRPLPPPLVASAGGSAAGLPSVAGLSRPRVLAPCQVRVVVVVPVVAPGRRPHHLENLYALQDALQAAATPGAPASRAGVPALPVASLPLASVASAAAAAARPLELTITTHHPEALNDSAAALAAADIAILPRDPAYAAAVGLLPPGAAVVELYPFAAAPPSPRRRRGASRGRGAAAPGGAVSWRASLAAAAAAADGSTEPLAAALGVAVTPVGGLPDGDAFATCLVRSNAAATSRRATAKLLRRWRRAARRAGRGGAGGGGVAGAAALPPVRGWAGGRRGGGRSPLRRAADACVAAQATIVDVPRVVAVVADHVRGRCVG